MSNPAAVYCGILGYKYTIERAAEGERGYCVLPDGTRCDEWAFLGGKCGEQFNFCSLNGLDTEKRSDGRDSLSIDYAVCTGKKTKPVKSRGNGTIISLLSETVQNASLTGTPISDILKISERAAGGKGVYPAPNSSEQPVTAQKLDVTVQSLSDAYSTFDWRNAYGKNWLTPVKNQGYTLACYAYAAVGTLEAQYKLSRPELGDLDLSEQKLSSEGWADTVEHPGSGCGNNYGYLNLINFIYYGVPDQACFPDVDSGIGTTRCSCSPSCGYWAPGVYYGCNYNGGIYCSNALTSVDDRQCPTGRTSDLYTLDAYGPVAYGNINEMKDAIIRYGPIYASMGVGKDFGGYWNGDVYQCTKNYGANHFVVIVGYDQTGWIVKNSWGPSYTGGAGGFFKVGYGYCSIEHDVYWGLKYGKPQLKDGSVSPASGRQDTTFRFQTTYYHPNYDQLPAAIQAYIDGVPMTMTALNTSNRDPRSGLVYYYDTNLADGTHSFYFYARDPRGNAIASPQQTVTSGNDTTSTTLPGGSTIKFGDTTIALNGDNLPLGIMGTFQLSPPSADCTAFMGTFYCNGHGSPSQFRVALYNMSGAYPDRRLMQNTVSQYATCPAASAWVNISFADNVSVYANRNYSMSIQPLSGNGFYYPYAFGLRSWVGYSGLFSDPHAVGWSASGKQISGYVSCYVPTPPSTTTTTSSTTTTTIPSTSTSTTSSSTTSTSITSSTTSTTSTSLPRDLTYTLGYSSVSPNGDNIPLGYIRSFQLARPPADCTAYMGTFYCNGRNSPSQFRIALYDMSGGYPGGRLMQNTQAEYATCPAASAWVNISFDGNVTVLANRDYSISVQPLSGNGFYYAYGDGMKSWIGYSSAFSDPHSKGWTATNKQISGYLTCYGPAP